MNVALTYCDRVYIHLTILLYFLSDLKVKCGHPFVPLNTKVKLNSPNLEVGTVATYHCDEGYETFGDTNLTCSSSGRWEGEIPFCGESRPIVNVNTFKSENAEIIVSNM